MGSYAKVTCGNALVVAGDPPERSKVIPFRNYFTDTIIWFSEIESGQALQLRKS